MNKRAEEIPDYARFMRPLSEEEGGGYLVMFPDLPGCYGTGDTWEEALADSQAALKAHLINCPAMGVKLPGPREYNGRVIIDLPDDLHDSLRRLAQAQGSDIHTVAADLIKKGLAEK